MSSPPISPKLIPINPKTLSLTDIHLLFAAGVLLSTWLWLAPDSPIQAFVFNETTYLHSAAWLGSCLALLFTVHHLRKSGSVLVAALILTATSASTASAASLYIDHTYDSAARHILRRTYIFLHRHAHLPSDMNELDLVSAEERALFNHFSPTPNDSERCLERSLDPSGSATQWCINTRCEVTKQRVHAE